MDNIKICDDLVRRMVRAIDKAIAEDIPQYLRENHKETNNAIIQLRGDFINDNLRNMVVGDNIEMLPIKRYLWQGRIVVDRKEKITYTITTQSTLSSIPKKQRNKPHFLQSVLFVENGGYEAIVKQMTLMDMFPFEAEDLENDYDTIVEGLLDPSEGYTHYIIAYSAESSILKDIKIVFLDKDFNIIAEASLNDYIKVDFSRITANMPDEYADNQSVEETKSLLKVKSGLRPKLRDIPEQV